MVSFIEFGFEIPCFCKLIGLVFDRSKVRSVRDQEHQTTPVVDPELEERPRTETMEEQINLLLALSSKNDEC